MEKPVTFRNAGQQIVGMLHLPERRKGSRPGALLCHGFTGTKTESHFLFTKMGRALAAAGSAVLRFDFRGSGDSEGDFSRMTMHSEISDGTKALAFLGGVRGVDASDLTVLGLSMGAVTAVHIAPSPGVKRLALLSPVCFPVLLGRFLTRRLARILATDGSVYIPGMGHTLGQAFFDSARAVEPVAEAERFAGRVLIIHAKDDSSVPLDHSLAYFKAFHRRAASSELNILAAGGHTFTTQLSEETVIKRVVEFSAAVAPAP